MKDSLGDRIKGYEDVWRIKLPQRMPVIIRLDGKAFHSLLSHAQKPFDYEFIDTMKRTVYTVMEGLQNAVLAYCQSDEISILFHNYKKLTTESWYDNNLQKMISILASSVSVNFTKYFNHRTGLFDARAFVLPEAEVVNYFIWRQNDAIRNSIQTVGQHFFSHKDLQDKSCEDIKQMLLEIGKNWNEYEGIVKRGFCFKYNEICTEIPRFSENREYISELLKIEEE